MKPAAKPSSTPVPDETAVTEITIQPDGRVFVFGTSRNVLRLLADLQPNDARVRRLLETPAPDAGGGADDPPP